MTIMMMIMTDPFTTNLVVKGTVVKESVVKGATSLLMTMIDDDCFVHDDDDGGCSR